MNSQQFVLFTIAALCLFSSVLSQSTSGSTSGSLRKESATSGNWRTFNADRYYGRAAPGDITVNITIVTIVTVFHNFTNAPINFTATPIAQTTSALASSLPFNPSNITVTPNFVNNATSLIYTIALKNNETTSATTPASNFVAASGSTTPTGQVAFFVLQVTRLFDGQIKTIFAANNITSYQNSTTGAFTIPGPLPPTTTTGTTTHNSTTTSLGTSLSMSFMSLFTIACFSLASL